VGWRHAAQANASHPWSLRMQAVSVPGVRDGRQRGEPAAPRPSTHVCGEGNDYDIGGMRSIWPGSILSGCFSIGLFASKIFLYLFRSP